MWGNSQRSGHHYSFFKTRFFGISIAKAAGKIMSNSSVEMSHATASHGPLARYVKLRVAHASGMPGMVSPTPWVSDPDMNHGTCVTHVPLCISGSLTTGFLWNWWRRKRSRHSRCMRKPQFYVSGKRPIAEVLLHVFKSCWQMGHPLVKSTGVRSWNEFQRLD